MISVRVFFASILLLSSAAAGVAQEGNWDGARLLMSRAGLQELLSQLEQSAQSRVYTEALRTRAQHEAALIRQRLRNGDFHTGDRVFLEVEGDAALSDTFTVGEGRILTLPLVGDIGLEGVLRSELEPHLRRELGHFLRDPVVKARALIRISIFGEVGQPGFYVVPTEVLLTDALMLAGGPTRDAKLAEITIERGDQRIWRADALQQRIIEGRTLDQLNLRAGDRIQVPREKQVNVLEIARIGVFALPPLIYGLSQIF